MRGPRHHARRAARPPTTTASLEETLARWPLRFALWAAIATSLALLLLATAGRSTVTEPSGVGRKPPEAARSEAEPSGAPG